MFGTTDEEPLLMELALTFPFGFWAELGRKLNYAYFYSSQVISDDPEVGRADQKVLRGHHRRAAVNNALRKLCQEFEVKCEDVQSDDGTGDNHVEIHAGRMLLTCHRLSGERSLPDSARYLEQNSELNITLSQKCFDFMNEAPKAIAAKPVNLLILHRESEEALSEVGDVELVFPDGRKRLFRFDLSDAVKKQNDLQTLAPDNLAELRRRIDEIKRNRDAS